MKTRSQVQQEREAQRRAAQQLGRKHRNAVKTTAAVVAGVLVTKLLVVKDYFAG